MEIAGSAVTPTGGIRPMTLADLADVDAADAQQGDVLINDGTNWVNTPRVDGGGA
jgi:hypothetical protein